MTNEEIAKRIVDSLKSEWASFKRKRDAADQMLQALKLVRGIIVDASVTGFNCKDGDWAERLFASQQDTSAAIRAAEGDER